jgi:hypothetical protein
VLYLGDVDAMASEKLPHIPFYTGDWLKEPTLKFVSLASRGLWIEMLCHMNESPERGYLVNSKGKPYTPKQLAKLVGFELSEIEPLLVELQDNDVYSTDERGAIYSRRMIRDQIARNIRHENGTKGGRPSKKKTVAESSESTAGQALLIESEKPSGFEEQKPGGYLSEKANTDNDSDIDIGSEVNTLPETTTASSFQEGGAGGNQSLPVSEIGIEGWDKLIEAAARAKMVFDPAPDSNACKWYWRPLSMEDRLFAVSGIKERFERGQYSDPRYVPTLENYLKGRKWRESLRDAPPGRPGGKGLGAALLAEKLARAQEKEKASKHHSAETHPLALLKAS